MELQLLKENDSQLRQIAEPWDFEVDGSPTELVKQMSKLMFLHKGIGLAGPQVGKLKRIFIMGNEDKLFACINPEIVSGVGKIKDTEGCLSFPELWLHVDRYETIQVKYQNIDGTTIETELSGLMARVFQHELDHLNGICFDTIVPKLSLKLAKERQRKLRKSFN